MRSFVLLAALLFAPHAHAQTLADLTWLTGCWRTEAPREAESGAIITEVWIAPPGPAMFGYSYTEGEGAIQGWEQTRIEMIDGWPHFIAMPNGGAPVRFRMAEPDPFDAPPSAALFENAAHDFPQRVLYAREGDRLTATISRLDGADAMAFQYRRMPCPANLRP